MKNIVISRVKFYLKVPVNPVKYVKEYDLFY